MADNRVIGVKNRLPWRLASDMRWFVKQTTAKPIIMGRKTFESFGAKPLKNRLNIVVSRQQEYNVADGVLTAVSLQQALQHAQAALQQPEYQQAEPEIMIIGGAQVYQQALPLAQRLYLTYVQTKIDGDAWFPEFDNEDWQISYSQQLKRDEKNEYDCEFTILERLPENKLT